MLEFYKFSNKEEPKFLVRKKKQNKTKQANPQKKKTKENKTKKTNKIKKKHLE